MTRRQRQARAFLRPAIGLHTDTNACPDCRADVSLVEAPGAPGVFVAEIRHDVTCPRYRQIVAEREGR